MGKSINSRTFRIAVLAIAAAGLLAATAWAGIKPFSGTITSNGAPVRFDATKKDGQYKTITGFKAGDATKGMKAHCDTSGDIQYTVEVADTIKVAGDGAFKGVSDEGDIIKGTISGKKASGTIKSSFTLYPGDGSYENCYGKEAWTATIAG